MSDRYMIILKNIFTIVYNNVMLPFCHFVASTFTVSDYNNRYFLNIDIYVYKYS